MTIRIKEYFQHMVKIGIKNGLIHGPQPRRRGGWRWHRKPEQMKYPELCGLSRLEYRRRWMRIRRAQKVLAL